MNDFNFRFQEERRFLEDENTQLKKLIKEKDTLLILQSQKIKEIKENEWTEKVYKLEEYRLKEIEEL